jgi:hypothetical protein
MLVTLASGCSELGELPGQGTAEQCAPPLTHQEIKKRCQAAFSACLDTPIQSIWSDTFGHSMCDVCRDVCTRSNGTWPLSVDGRPCIPR